MTILFAAVLAIIFLGVLPIFIIQRLGRLKIKKVTGQSVDDLMRAGQLSAARLVDPSKHS